MNLEALWKQYEEEAVFNYSILPDEIKKHGIPVHFQPKQFIVSRGEKVKYVYFVISGTAVGMRNYADGNEYNYFVVDKDNGNIGILEIFARESEYIASIICNNDMETMRVEASVIYDYVMKDESMMRRCLSLVARDLYKRSANDGRFYFLDGLNRVRYYLIEYYNEYRDGGAGRIFVNKEYREIASSVGISVRTVGRSIQKMKESREIYSRDRKLYIGEKEYRHLLKQMEL